MTNDIATTAMWDSAVTDSDAVARRGLVVRAKVALAGSWPFLAAAQNEEEFEHRLALMSEQIRARTPREVLDEVVAGLRRDWQGIQGERTKVASMRREAALKIEAAEGQESLPQAYVHVHKHAGDSAEDSMHQVDYVASPSFIQTVGHWSDRDEAMQHAREFGLPHGLPIYENGRFVEAKLRELLRTNEEFFHVASGKWVKVDDLDMSLRSGRPFGTVREAGYQADPDAGWRYHSYPPPQSVPGQGGQPTADGQQGVAYPIGPASNGPDGFPADVAEGEQRSQEAYQRQLTPGAWTVTPGTEWPTRPNAGSPDQTPVYASWHQAGEGIVPTPGPNPNYFSQGTQGLQGNAGFPEDPSEGIEPKTDNRVDDLYGAVPPQASSGSAEGQSDGGGYSRQGVTGSRGRLGFSRGAGRLFHDDEVGPSPAAEPDEYADLDPKHPNYQPPRPMSPEQSKAWGLPPDPRWRQSSVRHTAPGGGEHAPYRIVEEDGRYFVENDKGERKEEKGYASRDEAREHQKALYANVPGARESAEADEKKKGKTGARLVIDGREYEVRLPAGASLTPKRAATDGKIVGFCDHCGKPVRYHDDNGGHLRHLHNASPKCNDSGSRTAKLMTFLDPKIADAAEFFRAVPGASGECDFCGRDATHRLHQVNPQGGMHQIGEACSQHAKQYDERRVASLFFQAAVLENPSAANPTGRGADPYRAKTSWEGFEKQRPRQEMEGEGGMNANTPTTTPEPIKTGPNVNSPAPGDDDDDDEGPRDRDDMDEDD